MSTDPVNENTQVNYQQNKACTMNLKGILDK